MKKYLEFILIFFIALLFVVICLLKIDNVPFADNILPEMLGFCLEGIFFVVLFSLIVAHYTKLQNLAKKKELKDSVVNFLGIFLMWSYFAGSYNRGRKVKNITHEPSDIPDLIEHITKSDYIGSLGSFLKTFAVRELPNIRSLFPVIAQIGANHLTHWSLIINNLEGFNESEDEDQFKKSLLEFLDCVQKFNNLPIET